MLVVITGLSQLLCEEESGLFFGNLEISSFWDLGSETLYKMSLLESWHAELVCLRDGD